MVDKSRDDGYSNLDNIIVTDDMSVLVETIGYNPSNKIRYNATIDKIIVDADFINLNHPVGLGEYLKNKFKYFYINKSLAAKTKLKKFFNVVNIKNKDIFVFENLSVEDKISWGVEALDMLDAKGVSDSVIIGELEPYIDFEKTFEKWSAVDVIKLLSEVAQGIPFYIGTDNRRPQPDLKEFLLDSNDLYSIPHFRLIKLIKLKGGISLHDVIKHHEDEYINVTIDFKTNSEEKPTRTRVRMHSLIQRVKSIAQVALYCMSYDNLIYSPYYARKIFPERRIIKTIESSNGLTDFFSEYMSLGNKDKQIIKKGELFIRSTLTCSNIKDFLDLPVEYPSNVSLAILDRNTGKGYTTGSGLPYGVIQEMIQYFNLKYPNNEKFNNVYLDKLAIKKIRHYKKNVLKSELIEFEGKVSDCLLVTARKYLSKKGYKRNSDIKCFLNWVIKIESEGHKVNDFYDLGLTFFHDPLNNSPYTSLSDYLNKTDKSYESKGDCWSSINNLITFYNNTSVTKKGRVRNINFPSRKDVYPYKSSRQQSVRDSMPSELHEICIEVLNQDNYAIVKEALPSSKGIKALDIETSKIVAIDDKTVGRALHFLLLVPLRGYQTRSLDEGLLDSRVWDFETESYVDNTNALASFRADLGEPHSNLRDTALVQSNTGLKADLNLFINTNKTSSTQLVKAGVLGYEIPWPVDTGIENIDDVWTIIEAQMGFNKRYNSEKLTPIQAQDEDKNKHSPDVWDNIPYFVPLFRRMTVTASNANPITRPNLLLPISGTSVTKLFHYVLGEAEKIYVERYPQYKGVTIAFEADGKCIYDIHSLRVFGITELLKNGLSIEIVQMIVGHATEVMTLYYYKIRTEELKKLLIDAKERSGISIENQKELLRKYRDGEDDTLIDLFNLVTEWVTASDDKKEGLAPSFCSGQRARVINGGLCSNYDCKTGGISLTLNSKGNSYVITPVEGGMHRCGNCRYWKSGKNFLYEQIHAINALALEITNLMDKARKHQSMAMALLDDKNVADCEIKAEMYNREAEQVFSIIAYRLLEYSRRELMLDASIKQTGSNESLPMITSKLSM